jgi:exodeoxyribonuclease III
MTDIRLLSWNVNGLRAVIKKGFLDWIQKESPDILCLQETKAHPDQLSSEVIQIPGYFSAFASAEKKGYSGVAIYSKQKPVSVQEGLGIPEFDREGRTLIAEYDRFTLFNIYFPNGKASPERLRYKMAFYDAFAETAEAHRNQGQSIVTCGDVNTAHKPIDLARPKENENVSGFLPEERAWIDAFLSKGYLDTFRIFNQEEGQYSWWDYKTRARERNTGWRIDYFFISENLKPRLKSGFIMPEVMGSDHCPVGIELMF